MLTKGKVIFTDLMAVNWLPRKNDSFSLCMSAMSGFLLRRFFITMVDREMHVLHNEEHCFKLKGILE